MNALSGKKVTVLGLGRFGGGIAVTRWLVEQGATVLVADQDPPAKLASSLKQLSDLQVALRLGDQQEKDFTEADLIVASPAVPPHNSLLLVAAAAGVPITTEIRLFVERCRAPVFGVTGTKGKSTTSALLGRMLSQRFTVHVGGNIGGSLLQRLPRIDPSHRVVLELSSYMLHHLGAARWSPHVAVVTLIGSDHLEWHGGRERYIDAKRNILRYQTENDIAVINQTDVDAWAMRAHAVGAVIGYGAHSARSFALKLPGAHNQLHAQGAVAAAATAGITWDQAQGAIGDFEGLPHRLQVVHERDGVRWVDDSIATIPDAAIAALQAFESQTVIQIVGGKDKGLSAASLCAALASHAKAVLFIGATGPALADLLEQSSPSAAARIIRCGDLQTAIQKARTLASPGDVVLLSPGYPSYDQFVNFEQRGDAFAELARRESPSRDGAA